MPKHVILARDGTEQEAVSPHEKKQILPQQPKGHLQAHNTQATARVLPSVGEGDHRLQSFTAALSLFRCLRRGLSLSLAFGCGRWAVGSRQDLPAPQPRQRPAPPPGGRRRRAFPPGVLSRRRLPANTSRPASAGIPNRDKSGAPGGSGMELISRRDISLLIKSGSPGST